MSDKDSALNQDGNSGDGGQANSPGDSQAEVISALTEKLTGLESQVNSMRSTKDKSNAQTNKRLSEFEKSQEQFATMQAYLAKYGSPEEAARAMALDSLLQSPSEQQTQEQGGSQQKPAPQESEVKPEDKNLVPLLGIDEADPAYIALVGTGMTPNDAATQLAGQRHNLAQNADPNAASGVATGGGGGASETQQTVLEAEYQERLGKVRQGDWKAISTLKDDMRKKGFEIY